LTGTVKALFNAGNKDTHFYTRLPGRTKNGIETSLTEEQVTIILEAMKQPVSSGTKSNLASEMQGVETELSTALRLEMLYREIEEIRKTEIARLQREKEALQIRRRERCFSRETKSKKPLGRAFSHTIFLHFATTFC
jgi:hypothetical protein